MFPKSKKFRTKGKPLAALNAAIHARDKDKCVCCGVWVDPGCKFHHVPGGAGKQDKIECGVTICNECHYQAHHGDVAVIKAKCEDYLRCLYGDC